jgi:hypothetical protein
MVLWLMLIAGVMLLMMGLLISIVKIRDPSVDTDRATDALFSAITLILGALLGMLTVKAPNIEDKNLDARPDEEKEVDTTERMD